MDMEKPNKPMFKIDEKRLEKFLKEMPEEVKEVIQNPNKSNAWMALLFMMFFAVPNDSECDKKE